MTINLANVSQDRLNLAISEALVQLDYFQLHTLQRAVVKSLFTGVVFFLSLPTGAGNDGRRTMDNPAFVIYAFQADRAQ